MKNDQRNNSTSEANHANGVQKLLAEYQAGIVGVKENGEAPTN
jgi:hypothetical protein